MAEKPSQVPEKFSELYRLTPALRAVDFSIVDSNEVVIAESKENGPHSLSAALEELFSKGIAPAEDPKLFAKAAIARIADAGNYRVSHVEPGDKIWIIDGGLHIETVEGEKLFIPLIDGEINTAPESFTLVKRREDIKNVSRRALETLKDPDSSSLYEYMRGLGLSFKNDRPKIWEEMKEAITVEELREKNAKLKNITDDFLDKKFSTGSSNAMQNIAILEYLKQKEAEGEFEIEPEEE